MWSCAAAILLVWAPVEDREVVDSSLDSTEKAQQAVSSRLPHKAARTATGTVRWTFLAALKANMESALHDATPVCNVQRCLEEVYWRWSKNPVAPENPASLTAKR